MDEDDEGRKERRRRRQGCALFLRRSEYHVPELGKVASGSPSCSHSQRHSCSHSQRQRRLDSFLFHSRLLARVTASRQKTSVRSCVAALALRSGSAAIHCVQHSGLALQLRIDLCHNSSSALGMINITDQSLPQHSRSVATQHLDWLQRRLCATLAVARRPPATP